MQLFLKLKSRIVAVAATLFWSGTAAIAQTTPVAQTPPPAPAAQPLPVWTTDAALVAQLASGADAGGGFQIQPPIGYGPQTAAEPGAAAQMKAWVGPARADGTHGYVMVTTLTPPASEADKVTIGIVLDKLLEGIARRRKNWKRTPTETGTIAGQPFVRARWEGTDAATGLVMRGFHYVTRNGAAFIQVSSQDIAPHDTGALALAEASALTFRKPLAPSVVAPAPAGTK